MSGHTYRRGAVGLFVIVALGLGIALIGGVSADTVEDGNVSIEGEDYDSIQAVDTNASPTGATPTAGEQAEGGH